MANETLGEIKCPGCDGRAPMRKNKKLKWYINCPTCGILPFNTRAGQQMLIDKGHVYGVGESWDTPAAAKPAARGEGSAANKPAVEVAHVDNKKKPTPAPKAAPEPPKIDEKKKPERGPLTVLG